VLQGGSPVAELFSLTAEQTRERIIKSGELSADRLDEALALLRSPDFWAFGGGGVAVWGQRRTSSSLRCSHSLGGTYLREGTILGYDRRHHRHWPSRILVE